MNRNPTFWRCALVTAVLAALLGGAPSVDAQVDEESMTVSFGLDLADPLAPGIVVRIDAGNGGFGAIDMSLTVPDGWSLPTDTAEGLACAGPSPVIHVGCGAVGDQVLITAFYVGPELSTFELARVPMIRAADASIPNRLQAAVEVAADSLATRVDADVEQSMEPVWVDTLRCAPFELALTRVAASVPVVGATAVLHDGTERLIGLRPAGPDRTVLALPPGTAAIDLAVSTPSGVLSRRVEAGPLCGTEPGTTCVLPDGTTSLLVQPDCDVMIQLLGDTHTGDACLWPGVACTSDQRRVSGLDLAGRTGVAHEAVLRIGELLRLETLDVGGLGLTVLPTFDAETSRLQSLAAANNELTSFEQIAGVSSLRRIDLADNSIVDVPDELAWKQVVELSLAGNRIAGLPSSFADLSIEELDLSGNALATIDPTTIPPGLTRLDLSGNGLTDLPVEIMNLPVVRSLLLSDNDLTSLPALTMPLWFDELDLSGNSLTADGLESLDGLTIVDLSIARNALDRLPSFTGATIERLDASSNALKVADLSSADNVFTADFSYNQLTSGPIPGYGLYGLDLRHNQIVGDISSYVRDWMARTQPSFKLLQVNDGPGGNDCMTVDDDLRDVVDYWDVEPECDGDHRVRIEGLLSDEGSALTGQTVCLRAPGRAIECDSTDAFGRFDFGLDYQVNAQISVDVVRFVVPPPDSGRVPGFGTRTFMSDWFGTAPGVTRIEFDVSHDALWVDDEPFNQPDAGEVEPEPAPPGVPGPAPEAPTGETIGGFELMVDVVEASGAAAPNHSVCLLRAFENPMCATSDDAGQARFTFDHATNVIVSIELADGSSVQSDWIGVSAGTAARAVIELPSE